MLGLLVRGVVGGSRAEQWGPRWCACPPFSIEIQFRISALHRLAHPTGFALVLKQRLERSVADDLRSILGMLRTRATENLLARSLPAVFRCSWIPGPQPLERWQDGARRFGGGGAAARAHLREAGRRTRELCVLICSPSTLHTATLSEIVIDC